MKTAPDSASEKREKRQSPEKAASFPRIAKWKKGLLSPALSSRGGEGDNISERQSQENITPDFSLHRLSSISERQKWAERYREIRAFSEELAKPLQAEDCVIQSMPDASPAKWHLAHTSWFFETFILRPGLANYHESDPHNSYLFNSYYNAVGPMHCRARRGMISRPTLEETYRYREQVDAAMMSFFEGAAEDRWRELKSAVVLGLNHEQQHQELFLTDIKHMLAQNPLHPVYAHASEEEPTAVAPMRWRSFDEGIYWIGHESVRKEMTSSPRTTKSRKGLLSPALSSRGGEGETPSDGNDFAFDNEGPRHRVFLDRFELASRLVTNGEYLEFIKDSGYERAEFWLSLGSSAVHDQKWRAPLYWEQQGGEWFGFTLAGLRKIDLSEPVCHVSYFEADAYARWAGARLPTEAEWEAASANIRPTGNFVEEKLLHPRPLVSEQPGELAQMFGDVWEWTRSSYGPYPRYEPAKGALGEYNGKFMCNQYVLRGGSCATSQSHIRNTYRNFFPPDKRWQFMGIRLAKDVL